MAKPKRKTRKNTPPAFYEAMPAVSTPPVGLPQPTAVLLDAVTTFREIQQAIARRLRPAVNVAYVWATETSARTFSTVRQASRRASLTLYFAIDSAIIYGPSVAADIAGYAVRTRRKMFTRQARAFYLMVAAGASFALVSVATVTATATLRAYASDISSPAALLAKKKIGTTIVDRNGEVLFQGFGAQSNKVAQMYEIPIALKDATLAAEDPDFYSHPGFSWRGTARAAITDITHQSRIEGGSTLTQQLVKNALLTTDKNFTRKYQEILLAIELEKHYSKTEILQMYLNETYYGQGSHGIAAASETFFHKETKDLTLGESALLAGLPLGPSRFDPNQDLEAATGRRDYVLSRMQEFGKISPAQAKAAKDQPIALAGTPGATPEALVIYRKNIIIKAPHFVFYVLDQLRAKYGEDVLEDGITVKTTLDLHKQELAESAVKTRIGELSGHHVTNGGLVSIEPKTGDIVAMVGSVDYNAPGFGNVNVTLSDLQPGSSFKPIAYVTAFKKGWTGATTVVDSPIALPGGDGTIFAPQNYDLKFHGTVTLRQALDNSLNIPAVKVLQFAGIPDTLKTAHDLGITTLSNPSSYGLSLVLGGGEVRPIDMATVYATFANMGTRVEPRAILRVSDRNDRSITKPDNRQSFAALDPRLAYMITHILSDDHSRQPEFPANGPLTLAGRPAAAKTGTTNDFRDNWTVGYTPDLATAVWVGNNDHSSMLNVDGITGAAPIWHDYMMGALAGTPPVEFPVPAGVTLAKVCSSGGLANPWDTGITEVFPAGAVPTKACSSAPPKPKENRDDDKRDKKPEPSAPDPTPPPNTPEPDTQQPPADVGPRGNPRSNPNPFGE